jgi:capsular polysaccharide biosynthesis protein
MEEIDLKELFDFIKGKLGTLSIITISVCLLGCVYGLFIQKPMYSSYTTVILGGSESTSSAITQNDININRNLVETYAQIVKSRRVLDQVISELKLDTTYEELNNKIAVTALNNTEIIKITVNDADAKKAMNIANVTASYFTDEIVDLYNMNNVNVLDKAFQSDTPYNINVMKQIIIYFTIGFVLAAGILFVIFYFDRTIKSVEQVEQKIKLPILGSVQELTKGGRK